MPAKQKPAKAESNRASVVLFGGGIEGQIVSADVTVGNKLLPLVSRAGSSRPISTGRMVTCP